MWGRERRGSAEVRVENYAVGGGRVEWSEAASLRRVRRRKFLSDR